MDHLEHVDDCVIVICLIAICLIADCWRLAAGLHGPPQAARRAVVSRARRAAVRRARRTVLRRAVARSRSRAVRETREPCSCAAVRAARAVAVARSCALSPS
eukprot:6261907-Prymnesium_polylepis.2